MDDKGSEEKPKQDTGKQAEIAFRLYDKDKDGYITKSEMEKLSKNLSKEQIDKVRLDQTCPYLSKLDFSCRFSHDLTRTETDGSATQSSGK